MKIPSTFIAFRVPTSIIFGDPLDPGVPLGSASSHGHQNDNPKSEFPFPVKFLRSYYYLMN